jgi:Flp pilus assembly protein TadG
VSRRGHDQAHDRGQATVELALSLPVILVVLLGVVQVAVVVRDRLAVQLAAREAARAAAVSPDPDAARTAAERATTLTPIVVMVRAGRGTVTATVHFIDHTDVGLVGALLPDVDVVASVTMAQEPREPP